MEHELPLGRLEAFSDGVFAIAITLLVLELGVSADAGERLLSSILDEWPSYLAYVTSFLTIGVIWLGHSGITGSLRAADATLYRINLSCSCSSRSSPSRRSSSPSTSETTIPSGSRSSSTG